MRVGDHGLGQPHDARDHESRHGSRELPNPGRTRIDLIEYASHVQGHCSKLGERKDWKNDIGGIVHEAKER